MKQSNKILRRLAPAPVLAFTLGILDPRAIAPLHAEQSCLCTQQNTPLETARKLEALTAGGPFNPVQPNSYDTLPVSDSQDDGDTPPSAKSLDHGLR